jgi:L-amino acid N-acyltransferase YncA
VRHGVGSALLAAAVRELLALGFPRLFSTFLLGNESSLLWHWRNGFQLLSSPYSLRRMRQRLLRATTPPLQEHPDQHRPGNELQV